MKKVAVIFESSPYDRKGLFNSVHERIRHLREISDCRIDVYCMQVKDNFIERRLRRREKMPENSSVTIDGVEYRMLWRRHFWSDIIRTRLGLSPRKIYGYVSGCAEIFRGYDAVLAHSYEGGLVALEASRLYGVPYMVTWHGSDVHTHPMGSTHRLRRTAEIMEGARMNFFVSQTLMAASSRITENAPKDVLYNAASEAFYRKSLQERRTLRRKYALEDTDKVVAYVGNFYPVKNVEVLPDLFCRIHDDFESHLHEERDFDAGHLKFWVVGDGRLREGVENRMRKAVGTHVRFFGNVDVALMPEMMNCVDVLVLPSRNEGLPLVAMEAVRCGANVVGSDVGGIAEVVGKNHVVPFDIRPDGRPDYSSDDFVAKMADHAVRLLLHPVSQDLNPEFDWASVSLKENRYVQALLGRDTEKTDCQA